MLHNLKTIALANLLGIIGGCASDGYYETDASPSGGAGICDKLTRDVGRYATAVCDPGETRPAWCSGHGLTGSRECLADGTYWSRTTCPAGAPINQEADMLIISREEIAAHPDFVRLTGALMTGEVPPAVITVDDILRAFPGASVQESMRRAVQHMFFE